MQLDDETGRDFLWRKFMKSHPLPNDGKVENAESEQKKLPSWIS